MVARGRPVLLYSLILPLVGGVGGLMVVRHVDTTGSEFFETGKEVVATLDHLAAAGKARNWSEVNAAFSASYSGKELGLLNPSRTDLKDGIERLHFSGGNVRTSRDSAVAEWTAYLGSFDSIETFELHLHRLEEWKGGAPIRAIIRMETIGRPHGKPEFGIDRAYLHMTLNRLPNRLEIAGASMKEGERIIGERPQFSNIAHEAGVDFVNRYYPGYFNTQLKFVMLRYGPVGITRVD